jgi:hypothetical protein
MVNPTWLPSSGGTVLLAAQPETLQHPELIIMLGVVLQFF